VLAALEREDLVVTGAHMEMALAELDEGGRLAQRLLGFNAPRELIDRGEGLSSARSIPPTGFPWAARQRCGEKDLTERYGCIGHPGTHRGSGCRDVWRRG